MADGTQRSRHVTVSIADRRVAAGLTQAELAARSGVHARTIRLIENGRSGRPYTPSIEHVARIATALGVTIDDLILKVPGDSPT